MRTMQCKCGEVVLEFGSEPVVSSACYCGDCLGSIDTVEALGGEGYRNRHGGHGLSLVYSDTIQITQGADRIGGYYQRKPASVRLYTTCCKTPLGCYASALKVGMLNTALLDTEGDISVLQVNTGKLPSERRAEIEGGYKSAPLGFMFQFMAAAFSPFNGHRKVQWVPDAVLENLPSSQELTSQA